MDEQKTDIGLTAEIDRLEKANAEKKALLEREEQLLTRKIMGGSTSLGEQLPVETEEQKKKREAMEFWKGSGIDKAIEKYGP